MCNIAGYNGTKNAVPILLEMLRRQEPYDGGMSTGIATIHEGKLHYRKVIGDVDTLIRETDVQTLPGTIGIAHTRTAGEKGTLPMHPNLNPDETIALVTNGTTPKNPYQERWNEAVNRLDEAGYRFRQSTLPKKRTAPITGRNGMYVSPSEARVFLVDSYIKSGISPEKALALACREMYSDNVSVMVGEAFPDRILLCRCTRPMLATVTEDGTYIATCRFAFPEEFEDAIITDLPLHQSCAILQDGVLITKEKTDVEKVCEISPFAYHEAYRCISQLLRESREKPLYFDELEFFVRDELTYIWETKQTFTQHARVVYDILWQLDREGKLKREKRMQETKTFPRPRYFMWVED